MKRHVIFHHLAAKEYKRARRWYARQSEKAAIRFVAAVDAAVERMVDDPLLLPALDDENRWIRLRRFPYILYFRITDDVFIDIMAIAHTARRPGYWKRRRSGG